MFSNNDNRIGTFVTLSEDNAFSSRKIIKTKLKRNPSHAGHIGVRSEAPVISVWSLDFVVEITFKCALN